MIDSHFSSLIYRIIGKPERWHDEYIIEMMQQYLDEADMVDDPQNIMELAAGDQIISRLKQGNVALTAFDTLLDKSRFQMIILDEQLKIIYHNQSANKLHQFVQDSTDGSKLNEELATLIRTTPEASVQNKQNALMALDFFDEQGDQIYLRSIQSQVKEHARPTLFHILMVLDEEHAHLSLNAELVAEYGLTEKEQRVLVSLIHGNSIREISNKIFISENTVKSHLKSIYTKTGTNSQGAVISLILTHESQVLDSYFDSSITTAKVRQDDVNDAQLILASGEKIAYCDYGPKSGRPLIVFHSGFGSRLAIPPNYEEICTRHNRRIIIPDRPGLGKTPFIEGHPAEWNRQLQEFIDLLGIGDYEVLGSIIACQMAMSYAAQANQRLQRVILTSPVFLNEYSHTRFLTEILAPAARYVRLSPKFAREIYELWLKSVTLNLDEHYPTILDQSIGSAERKAFESEAMIHRLTEVFKEGARQSLNGILSEMVYCMTPLHLDLEKFDKPLEVWFGTEDKRISKAGVEHIFAAFENCKIHIREGYSEHIYYSLFEDIIR
jgi:pimeloyl-ACP methyl ester carboxylesterase/DNA-binding CsgD family transcriptional regulator